LRAGEFSINNFQFTINDQFTINQFSNR
jgi:hypothetical protein